MGDVMSGISGRRHVAIVALCALLIALFTPGVAVAAGVVKADAGDRFSLAVLSDGTLWGWGYNGHGELGDGTISTHLAPSRVGTATEWADVGVGLRHALAIKRDGTLWAWGYNKDGQLGIGHAENTYTPDHWHTLPTRVGTGSSWLQIAGGYDHSVGLDAGGSIWAWGANDSGQLGVGSTTSASSPILVSISPGPDLRWMRIWADDGVTLALSSDGMLWQWGRGALSPEPVSISTGPIQNLPHSDTSWWTVAPANGRVSATTSDSRLWAWRMGEAPRGFGPEFLDVGEVPGPLSTYSHPEGALLISLDHSLSLATDENGVRATLIEAVQRVLIGNDMDWDKLSAGQDHFLILKSNGSMWGWGKNTWGQLGNGTENDDLTTGSRGEPVRTILPTPIPDVGNMSESDARDRIVTTGFKVGTVSYVATDAVEVTHVISQTPAYDTLVLPGQPVHIVVSAGPPIPVPNVVGMQETDARAAIGAVGLGVLGVTQDYSSSVPSGAVISQNPAANTLVEMAHKVSLVVSKGRQRKLVPYTAGMTQAQAQSRLTAVGFVVGTVTKEFSSSVPVDRVTRTDPVMGFEAFAGDTVNIFVSRGKPTAVVSNPVAPATMRKTRYYYVYGSLRPKRTAGTYPVRIYKWRKTSTGSWKSYGYVLAKASDYSTYTRYAKSLKLAYSGRWRLRAYAPATGGYLAAWSSGYDYVTVK
jgi:beta-lactam-binding protein with PASTA domain/alpha-tubulin suppressor-like RCC1 family protein